jgi:dihydrofolate synthase/folylpolyglutamate synthase
MTDRCLADWLKLLETRHPSEIDLGLDRVAEVWRLYSAQGAKDKSKACKIITVAGTNGKGSCIASMQSVLLAHGYSVGTFTSPHFLVYNERICLSGTPVSDQIIVSAFETIESLRGEISLTYFEFNTLAALIIFDSHKLDYVLLEVGLGGRLDATNIIDCDVAVLTSIDLDHQQWLGETRTEIAREKLGIARSGRPLIIGESNYPKDFERMVTDTNASSIWIGVDFSYVQQQSCFSVSLAGVETRVIGNLVCDGLLPVNKTIALQALVSAGCILDTEKCRSAVNSAKLTGRRQKLNYKGISIILDVAHNPAATRELAAFLTTHCGTKIAVASVLEDKDWASMVDNLSKVIDCWNIAELTTVSRATKGHSMLKLLYNAGLEAKLADSIEQAFTNAVSQAEDGDTVVVFGSFYTVASVLQLISKENAIE